MLPKNRSKCFEQRVPQISECDLWAPASDYLLDSSMGKLLGQNPRSILLRLSLTDRTSGGIRDAACPTDGRTCILADQPALSTKSISALDPGNTNHSSCCHSAMHYLLPYQLILRCEFSAPFQSRALRQHNSQRLPHL